VNATYEYRKELHVNRSKTEIELFDDVIREVFQILRHWFHYKVPKWLNVMNSLIKTCLLQTRGKVR